MDAVCIQWRTVKVLRAREVWALMRRSSRESYDGRRRSAIAALGITASGGDCFRTFVKPIMPSEKPLCRGRSEKVRVGLTVGYL